MKIGPGVSELWGVENRPLPLTRPMAYTTACTTVQAVMHVQTLTSIISESTIVETVLLNGTHSHRTSDRLVLCENILELDVLSFRLMISLQRFYTYIGFSCVITVRALLLYFNIYIYFFYFIIYNVYLRALFFIGSRKIWPVCLPYWL